VLYEVRKTRQVPGEALRRWFSDENFDLIVWYSSKGAICGFQLCYRLGPEEKALTWFADKGFSHNTVDDGEDRPGRSKMTPILVPDGEFEKAMVLKLFKAAGEEIDAGIVDFVESKLLEFARKERGITSP